LKRPPRRLFGWIRRTAKDSGLRGVTKGLEEADGYQKSEGCVDGEKDEAKRWQWCVEAAKCVNVGD